MGGGGDQIGWMFILPSRDRKPMFASKNAGSDVGRARRRKLACTARSTEAGGAARVSFTAHFADSRRYTARYTSALEEESARQAKLLGKPVTPAERPPAEGIMLPPSPGLTLMNSGKVDLRVGQVLSAEKVKGSEKLLHLPGSIRFNASATTWNPPPCAEDPLQKTSGWSWALRISINERGV